MPLPCHGRASLRQFGERRFDRGLALREPVEPAVELILADRRTSRRRMAGGEPRLGITWINMHTRTQLYLPSYSPDFNPIEQLFAKLKTLLRKAAARTQDALWETIGTSLEDFTLAECHNYIVNSGYEFV